MAATEQREGADGGGGPLDASSRDAGNSAQTKAPSTTPNEELDAVPLPTSGEDLDFRTATGDARPDEVKVFDYIYGVLHSPDYRETYKEFLKIDFPRIPYPASPESFAHLSEKGEALRRLHLMEEPAIGDTPYPFANDEKHAEAPEDGDGDCVVGKPVWKSSPVGGGGGEAGGGGDRSEADLDSGLVGSQSPTPSDTAAPRHLPTGGEDLGRVYINKNQYFSGVPKTAWEFYIGGYQPAQKWLKDRKGRALSWDDIRHYQKIIKILSETDRIMKEIVLPLD